MTSFAAYDKGLPCKNPNCKSQGKSHPNCKCYVGMAKGGEVSHFCDYQISHHGACKYYAEGGDVTSEALPQHEDPELSIASYLGQMGLQGLLKLGDGQTDQSVLKYNFDIKKGHKKLLSKLNHLFGEGSPEDHDYESDKKRINDWIEKGGINNDIQQEMYKLNSPEHFAHGGEIPKKEGIGHDPSLSMAYPDHNILLQAAKGRMSNYLNSLKPQKNMPKLAFDDEPDTRKQEKSYKRALNIAAEPYRILDKIKAGTVEPEHLQHFKNLYPEVDGILHRKMAEQITKYQLDSKKPHHHIRQGLSMFLGTPLSGELTPQGIQAAQAVFQSKAQQGQPPVKNKKGTSTLSKADDSYRTSEQARASRQQRIS